MHSGTLFVISAPSGTGKTTILKKVMADVSGLMFSVSHTTRNPREGEQNGVDYHFVSRKEFEDAIEKGHFIEYAHVHDNLYGTSRKAIVDQLNQGIDVILDIDTQGADIIRKSEDLNAVDIFIAPPSVDELEKDCAAGLQKKKMKYEQDSAMRSRNLSRQTVINISLLTASSLKQ